MTAPDIGRESAFVAGALASLELERVSMVALAPDALWSKGRRRARRRRLASVAVGAVAAVAVGAGAVGLRADPQNSVVATRVGAARAAGDVGGLLGPAWRLAYPPYYSLTPDPLPADAPSPKFGPCTSFTSLAFWASTPAPQAPDAASPRPSPQIDVWITECADPEELEYREAAAVAAEPGEGAYRLVLASDAAAGDNGHVWVYASAQPETDARLVGTLWTDTGLLVTITQRGEPAPTGALTASRAGDLLAELARRWS